MIKVKLLLALVEDLRTLADSVQGVAEAIGSNEPKGDIKPEQVQEEKEITLEEVRGVLAEKSHAGFTAQIRDLLKKYGADKLSQIEPSNYKALIADAEGLK